MFSNANSFKAKIKNISKDKGIPAQQVQQHYLIEQVLKLISTSSYRDSFIVKGGYLIGQMIGLDKRTTMDLDVTLKGTEMSKENLIHIFEEILCSKTDGFSFSVDKLEPIRQDDEYGGFSGIVTLEDLIEEVMGNIADEFDDEDLSIRQLSRNKYLISGEVSLNDLNDNFNFELESKYYDTLSGILIENLGYIPEDNENIEPITINGVVFKPQRVRNKKIEKVVMTFDKDKTEDEKAKNKSNEDE